jgi:hypothetical protein
MSRRGIRFVTPEVVTDVGEDELEALHDELEKIAATNPPRRDVTTLLETLASHAGSLEPDAPTFEPSERDRAILLRATDHLRNLRHRGELLTLRDRLIGTGAVRAIAYRLRFLDARPSQDFTSYSLAYGVGERLVTPAKDELQVNGVGSGDPLELIVDDWRAAEE